MSIGTLGVKGVTVDYPLSKMTTLEPFELYPLLDEATQQRTLLCDGNFQSWLASKTTWWLSISSGCFKIFLESVAEHTYILDGKDTLIQV